MGLLALGAAIIVFRIAGMPQDITPRKDASEYDRVASRQGLITVIAGVVVVPLVWLLARSADKGQVVLAVMIGAMAVGLIGRLASPHLRPIMLFLLPCAFGAIGHVIGKISVSESVMDAYLHRSLSPLNYPMPLEYLTGTLMGVALGIGWARSFLHSQETERPKPMPAAPPAPPAPPASTDAG